METPRLGKLVFSKLLLSGGDSVLLYFCADVASGKQNQFRTRLRCHSCSLHSSGGKFKFRGDRLHSLLAARDKCTPEFYFDQVTNKYAPDLVARQIAFKIDNVSQKDDIFFHPLLCTARISSFRSK